MVDSRNIFDHARLHPSMEIILVLTKWPPFGTHFCHAVSIPKEITMYNQVKTIQRILLITKLIVRIYFMKGMMIMTILWISKLMVRISTMKEMKLGGLCKYMHPWRNDRTDRHRNRLG